MGGLFIGLSIHTVLSGRYKSRDQRPEPNSGTKLSPHFIPRFRTNDPVSAHLISGSSIKAQNYKTWLQMAE